MLIEKRENVTYKLKLKNVDTKLTYRMVIYIDSLLVNNYKLRHHEYGKQNKIYLPFILSIYYISYVIKLNYKYILYK